MADDPSSQSVLNSALGDAAAAAVCRIQNLIISYNLRLLLADILHANLSMIITTMHLVLAPPSTHGKGPAMEELVKFLNGHQHPVLQEKCTTADTFNIWLKDFKKLAEHDRSTV